jgi:hypothetical protein
MLKPCRFAVIVIGLGAALPAQAMVMEVAGNQLIASGEVARGDFNRFLDLVNRNPAVDTVILRDSPGGDARSGYDIGYTIRARGLKTAVSGFCRSSCSRMFLGGVERQFADDQPVGKTHVGFHGNYDGGSNDPSALDKLRKFIILHSDGKADIDLVNRWTAIPESRGFIYFFDSERLKRNDGASVFLCTGKENRDNRYNECEKIAGKTGYSLGIFTSSALVTPNK